MTEPLLTAEEVARLLKVSPKTVRSGGCDTGRIPRVRIGRNLRFRAEDVTKFINGRARLPFDAARPRLRGVR